jgi:hypothetical protein
MVGCASHRLNLAVKTFIGCKYADVVARVHDIMVALKTLNNGVRLGRRTHYKPRLYNATRWSSYHSMLKRYFELKPFLLDFEDADIVDMLPTGPQERLLQELLVYMDNINSVSLRLQREAATMAEARTLFDGLVELFPGMEHHLGTAASIVESPAFENAIVKLQTKQPLTRHDKVALSVFEVESAQEPAAEEKDFAARLLKKARVDEMSKYTDMALLVPPTSNHVERFFSKAKHVMDPLRQGMLPKNFEAVLFLKLNTKYWPINVVAEVVHKTPHEQHQD